MAQTKFPFQTLLQVRIREEEVVRRDYETEKQALMQKLTQIENMQNRIREVKAEIAALEQLSPINFEEIRACDHFIDGLKLNIKKSESERVALEKEVERRRQKLVQASQQTKVIEKLKERFIQGLSRERKRREQKEMDNLVVMRFRGAVNGK